MSVFVDCHECVNYLQKLHVGSRLNGRILLLSIACFVFYLKILIPNLYVVLSGSGACALNNVDLSKDSCRLGRGIFSQR
jgi:hypothetical protein